MQSYEHHVVHESLEMRHPYLQDPYSSEVEPTQITVAVFDRAVTKFKEVLEVREMEPDLVRDALKTLNEMVHHQVSNCSLTESGNGRPNDRRWHSPYHCRAP